jgi:hypothetical protein
MKILMNRTVLLQENVACLRVCRASLHGLAGMIGWANLDFGHSIPFDCEYARLCIQIMSFCVETETIRLRNSSSRALGLAPWRGYRAGGGACVRPGFERLLLPSAKSSGDQPAWSARGTAWQRPYRCSVQHMRTESIPEGPQGRLSSFTAVAWQFATE